MKRTLPGKRTSRHVRRGTAALLATGAAFAAAPQADAATFTVTSAADSGAGSLRAAVDAANAVAGADTIVFETPGPIVLTTGELTITDPLTVTGPGAASLTISGGDASRIFYVYDSDPMLAIDVTITGVTLTNGSAPDSGGAILSHENLTLEDVTVRNSVASCCGGGIASFDSDTLPTSLVIRDSTIEGNYAGLGGGLGFELNHPDSTLLLENVTVTGNFAVSAGGGIYAGVYYDGGAPAEENVMKGAVTITDSRITSNEALGGGGIFMVSVQEASISGTTISGNDAVVGGGMYVYEIASSAAPGVTLDQTTISGNEATTVGGGLAVLLAYDDLTITNSTISGNSAVQVGGGLFVYGVETGNVLLQNSTISGNQVTEVELSYGGGIALGYVYPSGSVVAEFSTITNNSSAGAVGGIYAYGAANPVVLISTVIAGNTAVVAPDAVGSFDAQSSFVGDDGDASITGTYLTGDPMLGLLDDNGGPTLTHMPLSGSPLIDAGVNPNGLTSDQRGAPREREVPAGDPDIGSVEVQLNDGPSEYSFDPAVLAVSEGGGTALVTVRRTNPAAAGSVVVNVTGGTATGADYTFAPETVEFADLEETRTVSIAIIQDALDEPNETITLGLENPVNGSLGAQSTATVTILDDEAGIIQFDPAAYVAGEAAGSASITVTRTGASDVAVSADVVVTGGTATGGGTDFTYATGTVSWAAGEIGARSVSIAITPDTLDEPDETVEFGLQNITGGASAGVSAASLTIQDDDASGTLQFAQATYTVNEAAGTIDVQLTRTAGSAGAAGVDVTVTGGTATNGADYNFGTTTVSWAADDAATKVVNIPITDDSVVEPDETIELTLQNPTGSAILGTPGTTQVTIADEDVAGSLGFAAATYTVDETDGTITITVDRLGGSDGEVSVDVVITGGTATDASDYTFAPTTLVWGDGDATPKTFTISIVNDALPEGPETIVLALQNPSGGAVIAAGSTTVTINSAAAAAAPIPTLDGWMRILMAGFLALLAVGAIRRGRFLASILLALFLLSSSPSLAAQEAAARAGRSEDGEARTRRRAQRSFELVSMVREGNEMVLTLGGGEVLRIDEKKVSVSHAAGRRRRSARQSPSVDAADRARVRILRTRDGEVLFARVILVKRDDPSVK